MFVEISKPLWLLEKYLIESRGSSGIIVIGSVAILFVYLVLCACIEHLLVAGEKIESNNDILLVCDHGDIPVTLLVVLRFHDRLHHSDWVETISVVEKRVFSSLDTLISQRIILHGGSGVFHFTRLICVRCIVCSAPKAAIRRL